MKIRRTKGTVKCNNVKTTILNTPTVVNQCQWNTDFGSVGRRTGGTITDAGSETVNVAAGTGYIKANDIDTDTLMAFDWPASNGLAIATDTVRYVGVEYNSGIPQVTVRITDNFNLDTDFPLAKVVNDGGSLHIMNNPWWVTDGMTNILERWQGLGHLSRDEYLKGLIIGAPGTRNLSVSAGTLWSRLTEFGISALDTSTPLVASHSVTFDVDDGAGGGTITADAGTPYTGLSAGQKIYITGTGDNDGYVKVASVAGGNVITTTAVIAGTDGVEATTVISPTFEYYYYNTTTGWNDTNEYQYSVLQYNDVTQTAGNELVALGNNKYANIWIYAEADDNEIAVLYPQAEYVSSAGAEAESPPTFISTHHSESAKLLGRIIIKEGVDAPVQVDTVFETTFTASQAADHGNLTGLSDDDHIQYLLINGTRAMTGDLDPSTDNARDLGNSSYRWRSVYCYSLRDVEKIVIDPGTRPVVYENLLGAPILTIGANDSTIPDTSLSGNLSIPINTPISFQTVGSGVTGVYIVNGGTGYSGFGTLSASGGGGSGFAAEYFANVSGTIYAISITNAGSGYTSTPTISPDDAGDGNAVLVGFLDQLELIDTTGDIAIFHHASGGSMNFFFGEYFSGVAPVNSALKLDTNGAYCRDGVYVSDDTSAGMFLDAQFMLNIKQSGVVDRGIIFTSNQDGTERTITWQNSKIAISSGTFNFDNDDITTTGTITGGTLTDGTFSVTGGVITGATNTNWDAAYDHVTEDGSSHSNMVNTWTAPLTFTTGTAAINEANLSQPGYITSTAFAHSSTAYDHSQGDGSDHSNMPNTWTAPLDFTTGTASISLANTSTDGYVSSTDWKTFNGRCYDVSILNPNGAYGNAAVIPIGMVKANMEVTKLDVNLSTTTQEVAGDLKCADNLMTLANAKVINAFDTDSGATTCSSITAGTAYAGRWLYLQYDSEPNADLTFMDVHIEYDFD